MSKRLIQILVLALLLINTAVLLLLWFNKRQDRRPLPPEGPKEFIIKELGLNSQQIQQYNALRQEHFKAVRRLNEEAVLLKEKLFDYIPATDADSAGINKTAQQISEMEGSRDKATLYHFRKLRGILNKAQQRKFDEIIKDVLRTMARPPGPPDGPGTRREKGPSDAAARPG